MCSQVGLGLLQAVPNVFKCHDPAVAEPDVYQATLASAAVLNAGFNIGSLMIRYQGGCHVGLVKRQC